MAQYIIKEIRDNVGISKDNPSFSTFDLLVDLNGVVKWISVPHEIYFPWAIKDSEKLEKYLEKNNFDNFEQAISDLTSLDYDWNKQLTRYIDKCYPKKLFNILPEYFPDGTKDNKKDKFDFDEDDEDF